MSQRLEVSASFECPSCKKKAACVIQVSDPNWGAADKMSDLVSSDDVDLECQHCKSSFQATAESSPYECQVRMEDHPETIVRCGTPSYSLDDDFDDWLTDNSGPDLGAIFRAAHKSLLTLLQAHGSDGTNKFVQDPELINRMVFAQAISAFEAYLGDALLLSVMRSPAAADGLMKRDKVLSEVRLSLFEVSKNPEIVTEKVRGRLKAVLYHNLDAVERLFFSAFEIKFFEPGDKKSRDILFQAIKYRHDCVHRNGRDLDGNILTVFSPAYVQDVLERLLVLVTRVERALKDYETKKLEF